MKTVARIVLLGSMALLAGCKDSLLDRSLVFTTATTLGVEVSVSPAEGASSPVKLLVGYKRAEGVLNPVYHSEGVTGPALTRTSTTDQATGTITTTIAPVPGATQPISRYRPDAYSVIAKIAGEAGASASSAAQGKLAIGQWFATGRAADLLAVQPGIAGAVVGSPAIADAAAKQARGLTRTGDAVSQIYADRALATTLDGLNSLATGNDRVPADMVAKARLDAVNSFASALVPEFRVDYSASEIAAEAAPAQMVWRLTRKLETRSQPPGEALVQQVRKVEASAQAIRNMLALDTFRFAGELPGDPRDNGELVGKDSARRSDLNRIATDLENSAKRLREEIGNSVAVAEALNYFWQTLQGSN